MEQCIFCDIAKKKTAARILYEDKAVLAFPDRYPLAPVHVLIIPKKHIASVTEVEPGDEALMGHLVMVAKKLAEDLGIARGGYKLLIRAGSHGGQEVSHLHLHLIGGAPLFEDIRPWTG
jgi:histidine triad (HIT) family protein|uniref:Histidine triad nucleotide-binding protein n=1 Tax=Desulfobacca acetoxidans TaxID=60893 RepID=A0A7V6A4S2_9BACT